MSESSQLGFEKFFSERKGVRIFFARESIKIRMKITVQSIFIQRYNYNVILKLNAK